MFAHRIFAAVSLLLRFDDLELDVSRYELRRNGRALKLERIPMDVLVFLVDQHERLVTREEIIQRVWGKDVFVDTENAVNTAVRKIRHALGDDPAKPRFLETVPGKGYRFVAKVTVLDRAAARTDAHSSIAGAAMILPETQRSSFGSNETERASIAVLPFVDLSPDSANEYFCDGLVEELITSLSKLDQLRVAARTSAFAFKGKSADVREIGQKLNVGAVLEGSVRKSGNRVRIAAQLISAADGYHLWSERYERDIDLEKIFDVQDEITLAVVDALKLKLLLRRKSVALKRHTDNTKAYEFYLRGLFHVFRSTPTDVETGTAFFQRAIQLDPDYALAHVGLAHAYRVFVMGLDMMPPREGFPKAMAAAQKALEIDPELAEAHAALGYTILWHEWDWNEAEEHFHRALQLNRNSADTHWTYAHLFSITGRHDRALAEIARARELDPLSPLINAAEGVYLLLAGRKDEALAQLRQTVELDPKSWLPHIFLSSTLMEKRMSAEAIEEARIAEMLNHSSAQPIAWRAYTQARAGQRAEAEDALENLLRRSREHYVPPYYIALVYNGLGRLPQTLAWLERGFEVRDPRMIMLKVETKWNNLRREPPFQDLLKRLNLHN